MRKRSIRITEITNESCTVEFWYEGDTKESARLFIFNYTLLDVINDWINKGTVNGKTL